MLLLGHLGIGYRIARSLDSRPLPRAELPWLLLGTITPDLIDKSALRVSDFLWVHPPLLADPFISGSRTFGHTLALMLLVGVAARFARSVRLRLLAIGMATHLFLDCFTYLLGLKTHTLSYVEGVLIWPLGGWDFPIKLWTTHVFRWSELFTSQPWMWVMEALGIWFLIPVVRSEWKLKRSA